MNETAAVPFPDELIHLDAINGQIDVALQEADEAVERMDKEYTDAKLYMVQNRGEIDPHEMFRSGQELGRIDSRGALTVRLRDKLAKLKDSPYFARIDFREDGGEDARFYIGRFAFDRDGSLLVSDWRSPVAGMFYDYEIGHASYTAPVGEIVGELLRKRQFKIKDGRMEYALESSVNIQDDVLQRELSQTSDEKMKSIIATIQKEQNRIIRTENAGTLIIQGVAGSGKTSIALHRVAFLLYRFKDTLSARNVAILSPNRVFGDYISNVLPELGEEPIYDVSIADIADAQLENTIAFEADKDPLETNDAAWLKRARFKSTLSFVGLLDEFIERLPDIVFAPRDYAYGRFTAPADMIAGRFKAYGKYPIMRRLEMIAEDLRERFITDNYMDDAIPTGKTILKALRNMLTVKDALALYKEFYKQNDIKEMLVIPARKTLEWADVYPFLYLYAAFMGLKESGAIKHLVIDEMQDYTPVQYMVLNALFKCPKTILGDFGQLVNPCCSHTLDDLRSLYDGAEFAEITKSYRSTYEIITFARRIKGGGVIDAIARHGEAPEMIACASREDETERIRRCIDAFYKGKSASLGIITRTGGDAKRLYDLLSADYDINLISPESSRFMNGVIVTSIRMAKGLEFDEVIVPGAHQYDRASEYDRSLLYVACTRAMHRLTLFYEGEAQFLNE